MGDEVAHVTSGSHAAGRAPSAGFFRPAIVFTTAYIIITLIHESAHALTAYSLNVPFTLYHFAVDLARDPAMPTERAVIGVAGPLCALVAGLISLFFYRGPKRSRPELLLLYLATFGIGTFFGNLMSTAFVGDFSRAAVTLRLPMSARYAVSLLGLVSVCGLMFAAGCELRRLSPAGSNRWFAMVVMIVLPVVAGTAILTLVSLPMPSALILGRLAETSFWIFAAVGLLMSRKVGSGEGRTLHVNWLDATALVAALIVVRVMAGGISFQQ